MLSGTPSPSASSSSESGMPTQPRAANVRVADVRATRVQSRSSVEKSAERAVAVRVGARVLPDALCLAVRDPCRVGNSISFGSGPNTRIWSQSVNLKSGKSECHSIEVPSPFASGSSSSGIPTRFKTLKLFFKLVHYNTKVKEVHAHTVVIVVVVPRIHVAYRSARQVATRYIIYL